MIVSRAGVSFMKRLVSALACAACAGLLAACSTTGQYFSDEQLTTLVPGRTTMLDATRALHAGPQQVYPQSDGTTMALWAGKVSFITDAMYFHKEAMLQFGADGRLIRLVDSTNVLLSSESRQKLLGANVPTDSPAAGGVWEPAPLQ